LKLTTIFLGQQSTNSRQSRARISEVHRKIRKLNHEYFRFLSNFSRLAIFYRLFYLRKFSRSLIVSLILVDLQI
jgi:hypothetical protein